MGFEVAVAFLDVAGAEAEAVRAADRFPGYAELRDEAIARRYPRRRTVREQRELVVGLVDSLFSVWDMLQAATSDRDASDEVEKREAGREAP